jgi:hypothetical protein
MLPPLDKDAQCLPPAEQQAIKRANTRKKPAKKVAHDFILLSCREYGLKVHQAGPHKEFYRKVLSQIDSHISRPGREPDPIPDDEGISSEQCKAIEQVLVLELGDYISKFEMKVKIVEDKLKIYLRPRVDDPNRIIRRQPYETKLRHGQTHPTLKEHFKRFPLDELDPLTRFSLLKPDISSAQLAFNDFFAEPYGGGAVYGSSIAGKFAGYVFEAVVATHAVHHEKCFCCKSASTLCWCGGSDTSWRDLYCRSCQSCFEIKSKANKGAIERISNSDRLYAGSFRRWCAEDFPSRDIRGKDNLVFVSRDPSEYKGQKGWSVYIAEIGTVLPVVDDKTFAEADQEMLSIRTQVTLKKKPELWFRIPGGELPDIQAIFRTAFETMFPNQWTAVGGAEVAIDAVDPQAPVDCDKRHDESSLPLLLSSLEGMTEGWDDEDDDDDDDQVAFVKAT